MKISLQPIIRLSNVYFTLALMALAAAGVYGFFQFLDFRAEAKAIEDNKATQEELSQTIVKINADFKKTGEEQAKRQADLAKKMTSVLPPDENYTDLTRQFDRYFETNDKVGNPMFVGSLRFGKGAPDETMSNISVLPVSMNIEATRDNFFKFLEYVNGSGILENGVRLMDIDSIHLNFPEGGELVKDLKQKLNFTVQMNAYYKTPEVPR